MTQPATQEELDRFMKFVKVLPNGCWEWTGAKSKGKGNQKWYGSFWFRGRTIRAHKFSSDFIGRCEPLPAGYHRDHTCNFSLCVRQEHLEKVPHPENEYRKRYRMGMEAPPLEPAAMDAALCLGRHDPAMEFC